ncbi:hypothetical protein [Metamycoplasma hominis]|uniref:hypothetical protein n=1 Tax=Metamycoplasma hominis TaxID=2098 RepID=UPI001313EAD4|nr:hypothetical protein [Metamycoplasma hominis]
MKRTKKRKIKKSKTKEIIKENKARKVKRNSLPLSPAPNKPYRGREKEDIVIIFNFIRV